MSLPLIAPTAPSIGDIGAFRTGTPGDISTDVVVIGTGAGGAVAGTALSARHKVLFLEAGQAYPKSAYQKKSFVWSSEHLYSRKGAQLSRGNVRMTVLSGSTVGGSTVLNSAICFRPPEHRLNEWSDIVCDPRLLAEPMRPYVDAMWQRVGVTATHAGIGRGNNAVLKRGMERLGVAQHGWIDRSAPACVGCGACHLGCPSGGKASVDRAILPEAIGRGAEILTRVRARHISMEAGTAKRIDCDVLNEAGEVVGELVVRANLVIVAASALRSPILLARSGVGGPHVGKHLAIHPAMGVLGDFPEPVQMWNGVTQGYYAHTPEHEDALVEVANAGPDQIFALVARAGDGGLGAVARLKHLAMAGTMIRDQQTGAVDVSQDELSFRYDTVPHHFEAWRAGSRLLVRAYFAAGALRVAPLVGDGRFVDNESEALRIVDAMAAPEDLMGPYGSHPQGTCRMGPKDGEHAGVVDENGRVHGTNNVYVMDGSIFPTTLGVNPQITIMALALALATRLL